MKAREESELAVRGLSEGSASERRKTGTSSREAERDKREKSKATGMLKFESPLLPTHPFPMKFLTSLFNYIRSLIKEYLPFLRLLTASAQSQAFLEDVADYVEELLEDNIKVGDFDIELGSPTSLIYTVMVGDEKLQFAILPSHGETPSISINYGSEVGMSEVKLEDIPTIYVEDVIIPGDREIAYHVVKAALSSILKRVK